jgi:hypothetical protein
VFAALEPVVRSSRQLTVVMLSDGAVDVAGTPFDAAINAAYAAQRPVLKKSRMPLVTVLRGYKGDYMAHVVAVAPWIGEFPAFPVEPVKTNAPAPAPAVAPKTEPKRTIIIRPDPKKAEVAEPAVALQPGAVALRNPPETITDGKPVVVEPLPAPETVNPTPVVAPAVVKPEEVVPVAKAEPAPPAVVPAPPALKSPAEVPVAPAPVPATTATAAADTVTIRKLPLILGISLMWVAIVVALVLVRRARRASATSIITQSFEKK